MSEVKKYECTVLIDASCGVTVEASSPEEAAELAENAAAEQGAGSLCHQCSGHTECGDSYAVIVYDGDKEVLDTDHRSKLLTSAQSELAALREELAKSKQRSARLELASASEFESVQLLDNENSALKQRLADAERRNAELSELLRTHTEHVVALCDVMFRFGLGMDKEPEQKIYSALAQQQVVFAALTKPEEAKS